MISASASPFLFRKALASLALAWTASVAAQEPSATTAKGTETSPQRYEFISPHMGTLWRLVFFHHDDALAKAARADVVARLTSLEAQLSDYKEDSALNEFCRTQKAPSGTDLSAVLEKAYALAQSTDGAFDPTVGPLVRLWRQAKKTKRLASAEETTTARQRCGWQKLNISPHEITLTDANMQLDLGGIAKGWAQDQVLLLLKDKYQITSALIDAGGGVSVGDPPPGEKGWHVAINGVSDKDGVSLQLANASLATSGAAHQFVEIDGVRYAHIVDPNSGRGLTSQLQCSVISSSGAEADALATAFCVMGETKAKEWANRHSHINLHLVQGENGTVWDSPGWQKWLSDR